MSHQARLIGIRRLAQEIEGERIKLLGGVPDSKSADHAALSGKIEAWQERFIAIEKGLKSQSHSNHFHYQRQRFSADAYSAKQRLHSGEANVRELSMALADVERKLRDLSLALFGGKGDAATALDAIGNAMGNWLQASKHSSDGLLGPAPMQLQTTAAEIRSYTPGPQSSSGVPPMPIVDVFTLILAYFALIRALSKK